MISHMEWYYITNRNCWCSNPLIARVESDISNHINAKIQCDKTNTEFYHQQENDQIKCLILFTEDTNWAGKQAFQSMWNIEQSE